MHCGASAAQTFRHPHDGGPGGGTARKDLESLPSSTALSKLNLNNGMNDGAAEMLLVTVLMMMMMMTLRVIRLYLDILSVRIL